MTNTDLTVHQRQQIILPASIADLGEDAARAFLDYFTAAIRNPNTRQAYFRNAVRFLTWIEGRGIPLKEVRAFHVAAYIEELGSTHSAPSVKQHLATLRMFGAFLVVRQILPANPTLDVRGPKHVVKVGKTPALTSEDARTLFDSIKGDTPTDKRDRAFLAVMLYTFGRVSAVTGLDISDYFQVGRRMMLRFTEKGGRHHDMPVHHTAVEYLDAYLHELNAIGGPLFRTINRTRDGYTDNRFHRSEALAMVKRRCKAAGLGDRFTNHTFRATGITVYLKNGGSLENAQHMANHADPRTTQLYDRRAQEASLDEVERIIL